jgi:acetylornithine/succinyldiaminopimelate/putrescine aminotransferase
LKAGNRENALIQPPLSLEGPAFDCLEIRRASGAYVYDEKERPILDCDCGGGAAALGHGPGRVAAALEKNLGRYDMGNHHLISEPRARLAKKLAGLLPGNLRHTVFNATSSEAVDVAVKLARGATGRLNIVCADNAYHGATGYSMAAGMPALAESINFKAPGFVHVPFGDAAALENILKSRAKSTAAVLLQPVAVEAGIVIPPKGYLRGARRACGKYGALLIVDETGTGLGRTGWMFAVESGRVAPDILIVGRALGAGMYPIHATCHTPALDRFFQKNPFIHISTYGGSELGCMAAIAALDDLAAPALLKNVRERAAELCAGLRRISDRFPAVFVDIRQTGLLIGAVFSEDAAAEAVRGLLLDNGVLCRPAAFDARVLLLRPPLNISYSQTAELLDAFESALHDLKSKLGGGA